MGKTKVLESLNDRYLNRTPTDVYLHSLTPSPDVGWNPSSVPRGTRTNTEPSLDPKCETTGIRTWVQWVCLEMTDRSLVQDLVSYAGVSRSRMVQGCASPTRGARRRRRSLLGQGGTRTRGPHSVSRGAPRPVFPLGGQGLRSVLRRGSGERLGSPTPLTYPRPRTKSHIIGRYG